MRSYNWLIFAFDDYSSCSTAFLLDVDLNKDTILILIIPLRLSFDSFKQDVDLLFLFYLFSNRTTVDNGCFAMILLRGWFYLIVYSFG